MRVSVTARLVYEGVERKEVGEETVDELNRCLDQLERIQSSRNVGQMAVHKVLAMRFLHRPSSAR